jgi:hypothetical protein
MIINLPIEEFMLDSIIKLVSQYKYKVSKHSYGLFWLKKAQKIQIEADATIETSREIFYALKGALGNPLYVHTNYGYIFEQDGKYISFNEMEETYGCTFLDIFIFDKIPSRKKITYEKYIQMVNNIKNIAAENNFNCEIPITYHKNIYSFSLISDKKIQALIFIHQNEIAYYLSKLIKSDNITRAISKSYGKETANRDDTESLRQGLKKIFRKAQSIE